MSSIQDIISRAGSDAGFRDRLRANPAETLRESGVKLSTGAKVEVIEAQPNEIHLNLGRKGGPPTLQKVLDRAETDSAYRKSLVSDPKTVLEQSLGSALPSNVRVHVHSAQQPGDLRLFLSTPDSAGNELSDAELESVAGGGFFKNVVGGIKELACRDSKLANVNFDNMSYQIITDTSHRTPTSESGSLMVW